MPARPRTIGLILAAAAGVGLGGCGSGGLDTNKAASTIRTLVASKLGLVVSKVDCPANVKLQKGLVTTCQVTLASGEAEPFTITQTDGSGHVNIQPASLLAGGVEKAIVAQLAAQGVKATASCPRHVRIRVGAHVTCVVRNAKGVTAGVVVTITDTLGSYRLTQR